MIPDQTSSHERSFQIQRLNPDQISLLQPFNHLPDELLLIMFRCLDPIKRSLLLPICRKWNDILLKNHSLWNSLVLEDHFSVEGTLSILRLFNSRSGYQLKNVFLGKAIAKMEDLIEIMNELKKSAASLRVLGLVQKVMSLNEATRKLARLSFPKLNTLNLVESQDSSLAEHTRTSELRMELGIDDLDEEMRFVSCDELLDLDEEEISWLSGLKYLEVGYYSSLKDLKSILKASKSSLKHLDLATATPFSSSENASSVIGKIDMEKLETFCPPWEEHGAVALSKSFGTKRGITLMEGKANCLKHFNLSLVERLGIVLCDEEDEDKQALLNSPTILVDHENLLRKCKSVNQLEIECSGEQTSKVQLDVLFKLLIIPSKSNTTPLESSSGTLDSHSDVKQKELGIEESDPVHGILLPDLVKLTIQSPIQLDGKLLNQLVQSRKRFNPEFEIKLTHGKENEISEAEWEARGCIDRNG